jgi:drug/metabolite transporter (DMT)-like permease
MTPLLTLLALVAFAANSLLCRLALRSGAIDPASFTSIRLVSGAVVLMAGMAGKAGRAGRAGRGVDWYSPAMLFLYAAAFSFAYVSLSAGTGALILFGAVQVTMLVSAMRQGERLGTLQWAGLAAAVAGVVYLMLPGLSAPSPVGATLMAAAGVAWGLYSVRGRGAVDPLDQTRRNFLLTIPMVAVLALAWTPSMQVSRTGVLLAVISGAVTSGLGYVIWYRALRGLSGVAASLVQLATPVLAAVGGILFLAEPLSGRLAVSAALVLGGIGVAVVTRQAGPAAN